MKLVLRLTAVINTALQHPSLSKQVPGLIFIVGNLLKSLSKYLYWTRPRNRLNYYCKYVKHKIIKQNKYLFGK